MLSRPLRRLALRKVDTRIIVLGAGKDNIGREISNLVAKRGIVFEYEEGLDVLDKASLHNFIMSTKPTHAVYSVGINRLDWMSSVSQPDFEEVMLANVFGFISMMQSLWSSVMASEVSHCSVVAITSDAAWRPMRTSLSYCASKAALEMAVKVVSRELAPLRWRVNAVAPGKVADTPMTREVDRRVLELRGWTEERAEEYELSSSPLGRKVTKLEVAEVVSSVLFGPSAMTGEVVAVNGGR